MQYSLAKSREERRNLFLVLFDHALHQINEICIASGVTEYSNDEIQPLVALLNLADAPEAFYISVKLGLVGIGEILRSSISDALSRYPNSERLNMVMSQKLVCWVGVSQCAFMFCFFVLKIVLMHAVCGCATLFFSLMFTLSRVQTILYANSMQHFVNLTFTLVLVF